MQCVEKHVVFGGSQEIWTHRSKTLNCEMRVAVYLPPQAQKKACPVVYWLSGLTCNEQNFITKAGAQRVAAELGMVLVAPDTSPRGDNVADEDVYDLGKGAGFYINAAQAPWASHYQMYDYVVGELPALLEAYFPVNAQRAISGHSMGGHGALMIALKNPDRYLSVSAFSPVVAPSQVPWGKKAFTAYLGDDEATWKAWDSCQLVSEADTRLPMRIEQGLNDEFLDRELKPDLFAQACQQAGYPLNLQKRAGYDHSYYFVASFIEEHLRQHHQAFQAQI